MKLKNIISKITLSININGMIALLISMVMLMNITSCKDSKAKIYITGEISNAQKKSIVLEAILPSKIETIQTLKINKKGCFEIKLNENKNCFYRLKIDNSNIIYLYLKGNDKINITASYPDISRNYIIKGSHDCDLLKELNYRLLTSADTINKMRELLIDAYYIKNYNADSLQSLFSSKASEIFSADRLFLMEFIDKNIESPVIYMTLYQYIDTSPLLSIENDLETFEFVLENLKKYNPDLEQIVLLESAISQQKLKLQSNSNTYTSLKAGIKAPDIRINNINNQAFNLTELRGKKACIYFWASWNKQSSSIINSFIELKNKNKDLEIILFSLDSDSEKWRKAVNSLKSTDLINVCDFKIWESPIIKVYGIQELPTLFILDEDGIIKNILQNEEAITKFINKNF